MPGCAGWLAARSGAQVVYPTDLQSTDSNKDANDFWGPRRARARASQRRREGRMLRGAKRDSIRQPAIFEGARDRVLWVSVLGLRVRSERQRGGGASTTT